MNFLGVNPTDKSNNPLIFVKTSNHKDPINYHINTFTVNACDEYGNVLKGSRAHHTPDDNTYQCYPKLQKLVPRCFSIIEVTNTAHFTLRGIPKFSAANSDEEDDGVSSVVLLADKNKATKAIVTEKANGKAFVATAIIFEGNKYWFGGSKNVHRLIRFGNEIIKDGSNNLISDMFMCFNTCNNLDKLHDYLFANKLTICGEYVDGKHIVYTDVPYIRWFGFSSNEINSKYLCVNIRDSLDLVTSLGLVPVNYTTYDDISTIPDLRVGKNSEGYVVHWLDNQNETIAMEKVKTYWYVIIRCLRQILLSNKFKSQSTLIDRISKTLFARNDSFMHLPMKTLKQWFDICCHFTQWFISNDFSNEMLNFSDSAGLSSDTKEAGMAFMWKRFMDESQYDDTFIGALTSKTTITTSLSRDDFTYSLQIGEKKAWGLCVFVQGVPGLGKNYICEMVRTNLETKNISCVVVDQDTFVKPDTFDTNGKKTDTNGKKTDTSGVDFRKHLYGLMSNQMVKVILVARNCATKNQYDDIAKQAQQYRWKTLLVESADFAKPEFVLTCAHTILTRKNHPTFDKLSHQKRLEIMQFFLKCLAEKNRSQFLDKIEPLNWMNTKTCHTKIDVGDPKSILNSVNSNEYRQSSSSLVKSMTTIVLDNFPAETPDPTYISLDIDKKDKEMLILKATQLLTTTYGDIDTDTYMKTMISYCSHVTFMHINNKKENETLWSEIVDFAKKNLHGEFNIKVIDANVTTDGVVFSVELDDTIKHLVKSGYPHITGILVKTKKPNESINILKTGVFEKVITLGINIKGKMTRH